MKKVGLIGMLGISLIFWFLAVNYPDRRLEFIVEGEDVFASVRVEGRNLVIKPWRAGEIYYFFLPSCAKDGKMDTYIDVTEGYLTYVDGNLLEKEECLKWQEKQSYDVSIEIEAENENKKIAELILMCSSNLPAMFLETESGNMDYIHSDKENEEPGKFDLIMANGNMEYSGGLEKISGRGNSSWKSSPKLPYSIKLEEKKALCGLPAGKKWNLFSCWREGSKMNNKIVYEIAEALGIKYSAHSSWIDLYLNGEYAGLYLLCEAIEVDENKINIYDLEKDNRAVNPNIAMAATFEEDNIKGYRLREIEGDITGGYLIEKDYPDYYELESSGFVTEGGNMFTVKSPKHISKKQVQFISDYIQKVEDAVSRNDQSCWEYIDIDSFAGKFLVDEIAWNFDTNVTSAFFYKNRGDELLYAGPAWDYDLALGYIWGDYENSIIDNVRYEALDWNARLYEDATFYDRMVMKYEKVLPYMERLLESTIDGYAEYIRDSAYMDKVRWESGGVIAAANRTGYYDSFDNNVKYLKFFLATRLNYLNDRWKIDYKEFQLPESSGEEHTVVFIKDGMEIEKRSIRDGERLGILPELDPSEYGGWYCQHNNGKKRYNEQLPIWEDVVLYAEGQLYG